MNIFRLFIFNALVFCSIYSCAVQNEWKVTCDGREKIYVLESKDKKILIKDSEVFSVYLYKKIYNIPDTKFLLFIIKHLFAFNYYLIDTETEEFLKFMNLEQNLKDSVFSLISFNSDEKINYDLKKKVWYFEQDKQKTFLNEGGILALNIQGVPLCNLEYLDWSEFNNINSITLDKKCPNLLEIKMKKNNIQNFEIKERLDNLEKIFFTEDESLKSFIISQNQPNLKTICIDGSGVENVDIKDSLTGLQELWLAGNKCLKHLTIDQEFPNLLIFNFAASGMKNVKICKPLPKLQRIYGDYTFFLESLLLYKEMAALQSIILNNSSINNFSICEDAPCLVLLQMNNTFNLKSFIIDKRLSNLQEISFLNSSVQNIRITNVLPKLKKINFSLMDLNIDFTYEKNNSITNVLHNLQGIFCFIYDKMHNFMLIVRKDNEVNIIEVINLETGKIESGLVGDVVKCYDKGNEVIIRTTMIKKLFKYFIDKKSKKIIRQVATWFDRDNNFNENVPDVCIVTND